MTDQITNPNQEAERYKQTLEREAQRQRLHEERIVEKTFADSPVKFKLSNADVLRTLGGSVNFNADQVPMVNGIPLAEMLISTSEVNPMLVADAVDERFDQGESTVKSKADLKTVKDRVLYIEKFGEMAFARLPQTASPAAPAVPTTYAEYRKLPLSERSRLAGEKGPSWIAALQRRASEQTRYEKLVGSPVRR